jgi:hypothetical protein
MAFPPKTNVTKGPAAAKEMAGMERDAKKKKPTGPPAGKKGSASDRAKMLMRGGKYDQE